MVSGGERPDLDALRELQEVLRHLESELAAWRRRALSAETRLAEWGVSNSDTPSVRSKELEDQNRALEQRLQAARGRLGDLMERLRFLEQQQGNGGTER